MNTKRRCLAIMNTEDQPIDVPGDPVYLCGAVEHSKPFPSYVPLCAAHRTMAEVGTVKVLAEESVAEFKL